MPEASNRPSVQTDVDFHLSVNGNEIPRSMSKISINVMKMANKLSSALLVLHDGNPATGEFPLSDGDLFTPGNEIQVSVGAADQIKVIFKGLIIKQSLKIRSESSPQLLVECRHKAVKTTLGRKNACFHDSTDSDVMAEIFKSNGFSSSELDIEDTTLSHKELVQYNCTDWDFILIRAEASGKVILTLDDKIIIKSPTVTGDPVLSLLYGDNMIELDAEIDSRGQYSSVISKAWDMANQSPVQSEAKEPSNIEELGNLAASDLAQSLEAPEFLLNHSGAITPDELQTWADARMLKSRLAKVRGRVKFGGFASLNPGDVLEVKGLGKRFSGKAFVSGVRQDYDGAHGWKTQAQFGHSPDWFAEERTIAAPKAGGLLPGTTGLHTGIVTDNEDPDGELKVRVKFPFINEEDDGVWARMALIDAGKERGFFFRPEIGDEVLVGFFYDDPRQPVILGMLHSSALASPISPSNDNHEKGYTSREKIKMIFNDDKKSIQIETPGGNKLTLSDDAKGITLEDQNANKIEMNDSGITITAAKKLELKGGTELAIGGPQITLSGDSAVEIKGGSTKVESSGALTLKGSLVKIN